MTEVCPACGQPILMRCGIRLQRKKAELFDVIEKYTRHGNGIELDRLAWLTYPDDPRLIARQRRVRVHINQLNDLLEATDCRVVNRDGRYRVSGV